ncbi:iron ABC transporter permease [Sedimentibacter sp. B4]|uniref:ABC transporter permease n=1 Tax=Sedimentibacter sp. B4 TaxID=304766 RepID=UPI00031A0859|nr:iron ABC transporter permease [Sedimentibacter sp. B4]
MKNKVNAIRIISTIIIFLIVSILSESVLAIFEPSKAIWNHIKENLLIDYTINTVLLVFFSMMFSGLIGTVMAYIVTCFDFFGRKVLSILLYFPLAIPPYIGGYVYMNMMQVNGIIANLLGRSVYLNSLSMAILVFTLFLFPYVYIGVKGYLSYNIGGYVENARLLGKGELSIFAKVIVPISKSAIFSSMLLVGLEVLGDFGVVQYFGVPTFATAIFKSWISFKDFDSAIRLSGNMVIVVFILLVFKNVLINKKNQSATTTKSRQIHRRKLSVPDQAGLLIMGLTVTTLSFGLPIYQLFRWAAESITRVRYVEIFSMLKNTISMTMLVSVIILIISFILASYTRVSSKFTKVIYGKSTLLSYAIPGSVVAMMIILFFRNLDSSLNISLSTTIIMLIIAYVLRYLGVAYENLENGFNKVGIKFHEASRLLGNNYYESLFKVDLPILKPFIISSFSMVLIDLIKELPLTLILRPFNFHTLATQAYQYASDEMLAESAVPSLIIISICMFFVVGLAKKERRI